jgi:UDP-N-acetylmuramyl pentapeptide phosphotransferase/UDP-N-acetylglucosamine-1-phosphate transferase
MFSVSVVPALVAFAATALVLQVLMLGAHRFLPVDRPNERSLHARPIPRFGGLAMLAGALSALLLSGEALAPWLWPIPALAAISLLDDFATLPAVPRFVVQIGVAAAFAWSQADTGVWLAPLVIALVWMTNLYNFMDGSDGLAGGMALAGFGGYALLAWLAGDAQVATICLVVCGAALAFLLRNLHPASVFMGDAGSIPLGFLAAGVGLIGVERGLWSAWVPVMMFLVFIADASVTLAQRLLRGERVWQAHRSHYYQRLVRMGLGHAQTAKLYFAAMIGCAASAAMVHMLAPGMGIVLLLAWCTLFALMGRRIDRRWRAFEAAARGSVP